MISRGRAVRIALMFIAALALIECGMRMAQMSDPDDHRGYRSFPDRARSLIGAPAPRIALIGNSVTDRLEIELLQNEWKVVTGESLAADKFVAYYSNLATWHWMSEQYFWKASLQPDLIVMTYYDEVGLADAPLMEVGNLAQYFTDRSDIPSLFAHDIKSLEQRSEYLLSTASTAFAGRDRIRDRTLNLIPGYRDFAEAINAHNFEHEQKLRMRDQKPSPTFLTLRRLVTRARQEGVQICFVAFRPRPVTAASTAYDLHPEALAAIEDAGMFHLDLRAMDELTYDMYQDKIHLNALGRPIYTRRLAQELNRIWHPR